MVDKSRRFLFVKLVPVFLTTGCLETLTRDNTIEVSNETDRKHSLILQFVDDTTDSVVSENEITLGPGAKEQFKVQLPDAGHESSQYSVIASTESGLRKTYDLGEGVFYTMDVTIAPDGIDISHTIR